MDWDEIEANAASFYFEGNDKWKVLLGAWKNIPEEKKLGYPEIAFNTAKVLATDGNHVEARKRLTICLQAWKEDLEKQARVFLMHAHLSYQELDFSGLKYFVTKVQELSNDQLLLAECELLLGEAIKTSEPDKALRHFEKARKEFLRISIDRPIVTFNVVRADSYAAEMAFQQDMRTAGWQYLNEAEQLARTISNPVLLGHVMGAKGQAYEREGHFDKASGCYDEAIALCADSERKAHISYQKARLALLMNDDKSARKELDSSANRVDHRYTLCQHLLVQGWVHALNYEFAQAISKLKEARVLQGNDIETAAHSNMLEGLIHALQGVTDTEAIRDAVEFFTAQDKLVEASQAKLILGWIHAISGDLSVTQSLINQVENDIQILGHVSHLARLYEVSIAFLGGWWTHVIREKMHHALKRHWPSAGIWVYGFGEPQIFVRGGKLLQQRDRYGLIGVKLLLYLLEKRHANLWEVVTALWPDSEPGKGQNRFHVLMSTLKKGIGVNDWCTYSDEYSRYEVKKGFPYYYDADDFNQAYRLFFQSTNPAQRLAICFKLINLYDIFAKGIEGEVFDGLRRNYQARYEGIIIGTQEILPELAALVTQNWYAELIDKIRIGSS